MLELLLELLLQVVLELVFEFAAAVGWESLKDAVRPKSPLPPAIASVGYLLLGVVAGGISLLVAPERLVARSAVPGISLLLSPLATGAIMHLLGEWCEARGWRRPVLFAFQPAAICAFGLALVRFVYLESYWPFA